MKTKKYRIKKRSKTHRRLEKNDFYSFVNKHASRVPQKNIKYLNKVDDFRLLQYKVFDELYKLIRQYLQTHHDTPTSNELANFFQSSATFNSIAKSKVYLQTTIEQLDTLRQNTDSGLWKLLALINRNDLTNTYGPFVWRKAPDFENPSQYIDYLTPHQFAIFDVSAYEKQEHGYAHGFQNYVHSLFNTTLPNDSLLKSKDVFEVAQIFYSLLKKQNGEKKSKYGYTKVHRNQAQTKYGFDWDQYCLSLGYTNKNIPSSFYVENVEYFQECIQVLKREWNSDTWRSYWVWLIARYVARLTDQWERVFYNFYGKRAQGIKMSIRSVKTHAIVNSCIYAFGPLLHNLYIDFAYQKEAVVYTEDLANKLRKILIGQLERNEWLTSETRKKAQDKVAHIDIQVGSKRFPHPVVPLLNFDPKDYLGNFLKVGEWRHQQMLTGNIDQLTKMDFTKYPAQIQSMPSFSVNALYSAQTNRIQITTAYLQKPFLDLGQKIEYNLASMGWTIAHELTHALDNIGSLYDRHGKLHDWWTQQDRTRYRKLQQDIQHQYETFAKDDKYFKDKDFAFTMDEDLADISGLSICEEYLLRLGAQKGWSTEDHLRLFYEYFAHNMRQRIDKQSTRYQLITNPHPIDKFRTNVPLSRSSLFRQIFDVKKGDGMYWKNHTGIWSANPN